MHILWRITALFWRYWPRAIVTYLCLLAGAGLALVIPRLTGQAIDLALSSGRTSALVFTALAIAGAGLLRSVLSYWQNYLAEFLAQRVAYDLRNRLYNRLQQLSYAFHDRSQTGQLMSRVTADVEGVRMFVGFGLLRGVYFFVLLIAISVVLFSLNWQLALLSLSVLPFVSFRSIAIYRKLRVLWVKIQQGIGVLGTIVQENLVGARVVRAFAREDFESQKFRRQAEIIYDQEIASNNLLAANSPFMDFALLLAMGGILWYGGSRVVAGVLTKGELAQFLLYVVMLNMPVRMLGWLTTLYSRAMSSGQRVFEILDEVSSVTEKPEAIDLDEVKGFVSFENVSFNYDSYGRILKDINFEVKPGQIVALVGASGSGKSTIANLLPRFYDVTAGRITIDGIDVRDLSLASLRRHVGIVHQDTFLFSATIRENISYGRPEATLDEVIAAARIARLHDFIMSLPDGYETWVGERGVTLSGGQKQRLAIARSILLNPRIIIMDDSTSNVDTETEYFIQQALSGLIAGRTTFIIAQRLRSVQVADLIVVLKDGRIVEQGTHQELISRAGFYQQLFGLQFQYQEGWRETSATTADLEPVESPEGNGISAQPARRGRLTASDDIVFSQPYNLGIVARLAKYFTPYKVAVPLTIIATLLYTFTIVASPYLVRVAIDDYIVVGNLAGLSLIILLFLGNALLNLVSLYVQIRAEASVGQGILLNLRTEVFDHLQRLSLNFFDRNEVGRIMSRVQNDVGQLGEFLDSGIFWVTGEVMSLIAIAFAMFAMNFDLALVTLSVIPLLFLFLVLWQKRSRRAFVGVRQAISAVNAALQENISGVRVIQSLSREEVNSERFEQVNRAHFQANLRAGRLSSVMMPVVELLAAMATALIIVFGGMSVMAGTLLVGTVVAFALYIQSFFDPIRALSNEYAQLQRAIASANRILELLDVKPEVVTSPQSIEIQQLKGEISFENVSFSYEPGLEVLHDINLRILPGETVALVGPTGAGKSTMVSLIARFYDVTKGRILADGNDLRDIEPTSYRRQLGLVLQEPFLFSGTIRENIGYGNLEATEEEIVEAARTVGAHDFIMKMERGYDTWLQERGQNLSMGQRQLISCARALLANPVILLLDEATANVDSYSEQVLQQALEHLLKGRTAVVIAHRLSTIRNADRIVVLDKGRIVEEGCHEELIARGGLYSRLNEMTFAKHSLLPLVQEKDRGDGITL
ncbi:MAG: ABC transporter ATP-binding protein [Chloroflexi bacterium]|nr:ABC transporter ATP-binding protein [Chloroflexota bacterium]